MIFNNVLKKYEKNTALITLENSYSYKDLATLSNTLSKKLKSKNLVFLICGNDLESIVGYLSIFETQSATVLVDEKTNLDHIFGLINTYKPEKIFVHKNTIIPSNYEKISTFKNFNLYKRKRVIDLKINKKLALLIPTSGSTGSPKYVRISKENIIHNASSIIKYLKIKKSDISITTLPMSYVYGLSVINTHLFAGAKIVLNKFSVIEKKFWDLVIKNKVTNFSGVPYTYEILDKINFYKKELRYIKFLTQAGGRLNSSLNQSLIEKFVKGSKNFFVMYGAAEATARMSYVPTNFSKRKIGSIGIPIPGGKFWLQDDQGKIIKNANIKGELLYSGENVCLGYAKNIKDLSKGDVNKGILKTGDIAYRDEDGFYFLVGRKDRYVKIHGNRVNLAELENNILSYGKTSICKLINKKITIFLKTEKDEKIIRKNLHKFSNLHPSVFRFMVIEDFPINKNYKLSYNNEDLDKYV